MNDGTDQTDELTRPDAGGDLDGLRWVSGSGGWPGTDASISGGDGPPPAHRRRDPAVPPLLRPFYVPDPPPSWDDVQSLPSLAEAPLRASELRAGAAGRAEPRSAPGSQRTSDAGPGPTAEPHGPRPLPPRHTWAEHRTAARRVRWTLIGRFVLLALSVAVLLVGAGLLVWALLAPAQPPGPDPVQLVAAGPDIATAGPAAGG